jgi:hypothetical protein
VYPFERLKRVKKELTEEESNEKEEEKKIEEVSED